MAKLKLRIPADLVVDLDLGDPVVRVPHWRTWPKENPPKGEERLFPADRNRIVDVGRELGAMLREGAAKIEPSRPNLRRGHWHGFWTGPRKENRDQQKFFIKWLPPVFVQGRN